jgi:hypothetical protein
MVESAPTKSIFLFPEAMIERYRSANVRGSFLVIDFEFLIGVFDESTSWNLSR